MIGLNSGLTDDSWVRYGFVRVKEGFWDGDRQRDELRRCHGPAMREKSENLLSPLSVMSHTCTLL